MTALNTDQIWSNWVALQDLRLERRTGRLLGFYAGRHYLALDLQDGAIASVQASDRELRIEQIIVRLELVAPRRLRTGLHDLARHDDAASVIPHLLRRRAISRRDLVQARSRQMVEIMRAFLVAPGISIAFINQPHVLQSIETVVRIEDALASAYAEEPYLRARAAEQERPAESAARAAILELPKPSPKQSQARQRHSM